MIRRAKTPICTDYWFGITFRGRHLSVSITTVSKKQAAVLDEPFDLADYVEVERP